MFRPTPFVIGLSRFVPLMCFGLAVPAFLCAQALKPSPQEFFLQFPQNGVAYAEQISLGSSFTMEAWVYLFQSVNSEPLIMGRVNNPRTDPIHYALGLAGSRPLPRFYQSTGQAGSFRSVSGPADLPLFRWTHLATTLDAGVMRLYVNGELAGSVPSAGPPISSPGPFSLGGVLGNSAEPSCGCSFSGAMREARIWSRALSSAELSTYASQKLKGDEAGLIANWPLSEGSGQTANGIGPKASPLTIRGGATWTTPEVLENGPYWEIEDLPKFSNIPAGWSGPTGLFLNANRRPDILVVLASTLKLPTQGGRVLFLRNEGNRTFTPVEPVPPIITEGSRMTVTADFDRDGFEDIVLAGHGLDAEPFPGGLTRIFMQRSGEMREETASRLTPELALAHGMCSADVDKNGAPDLVYAATSGTAPLVGPKLFLNDGAGHFSAANNRLPLVLQAKRTVAFMNCAFADVNRDGWPDLLLGCCQGAPMDRDWLLLNDGAGNFRDVTAQAMPLKRGGNGWTTVDFAVADFNRDGWPDVAATISRLEITLTQLLINNRDGTFHDQPDPVLNTVRTGVFGAFAYAPDFNQDGWPDLVVDETSDTAKVRLYQNMGSHFADRGPTLELISAIDVHMADFDDDGRLDMLLRSNNVHRIAWGKGMWPAVAVATPVVTSVRMAGGGADTAPNGWIEIKGQDLAPLNVPVNGATWSDARDFAFGEMPSRLGGVSVTIGGKTAYMYYVSPTQLNVLAPVDGSLGTAQIVVTSGGLSSLPFHVNMRSAAPSFPLFGSSKYLVATHADNTLVGPTSLSTPGYPVTPAKPGETIVLYGFGFGLVATPMVVGSWKQSGNLPSLPAIQFGGTPATVVFAGVVGPGLYQFNVIVPATAQTGDSLVICTYDGFTGPAGNLIAVER